MSGTNTDEAPTVGGRLGALAHLDLPQGAAQPALWRFLLATVVAIGLSLAACAVLAALATAVDPALRGYEHFQFADYAKLTVIGVVVACLAWPVVTWFSSRARRVFLVLAVLVTVASLVPDAWIWLRGQPAAGVLTLVLMHLALFVVTYPALVLLAPQPRRHRAGSPRAESCAQVRALLRIEREFARTDAAQPRRSRDRAAPTTSPSRRAWVPVGTPDRARGPR